MRDLVPPLRATVTPPRTVRLVRGAAAVLALAAVVAGIRALPGLLARVPLFDVSSVEVEGAVMVDDREILEWAAIPDSANVWDDRSSWEAAVAAHPVVRRARIRRRLPSTLVVEVEEREAVAFLASPVLEPVDVEGRLLPVDPSRVRLDLPVVRLLAAATDDAASPSPHRVRPPVEAVARLRQNPAFHGRLSEIREEPDGSVTALWGSSPGLEVRLRLPVDPSLVDTGLDVLALALSQDSTRTPRYLDLRFAEQIVVGYGPE